jgi:hypothetical protein
MSAGVVVVHHNESAKTLVVERTRGARWETGSWDDVTAEAVQSRLESTMQAYRDLLGDDGTARPELEPPRFNIAWPTRIGLRAPEFGLPSGARLSIVDLPGLRYVDDDINGDVVRQQAKRALCVVAYNSFETDPRKQEALLTQVVDQVKALSGSPARMLFVLNRIDAYRTDRDPTFSERAFSDRVTRQIRAALREALPEHAAVASEIEPIPLSSEPALYAVLGETSTPSTLPSLLRRLAREYAVLFPDAEMDRLPRVPDDWSEAQRRWFLSEAKHQARLAGFERRLGAHIAQNLPELLLPDLVDGAFRAGRQVIESLDALIAAYRLKQRREVEAAKGRLETIHQRLRSLQKEALDPLNPLREVASGDGDLVEKLLVAVPKVEAALKLSGANGDPGQLAALPAALPDAVQLPLQRLNDHVFRLMKGEELDDVFVQSAAAAGKLQTAVVELRRSPYGRAWKNGGSFEGREAEDVSKALSSFAKEISIVASSLIGRESSIQAERMKAALDSCGAAIIERLEREALAEFAKSDGEFQGLRGVFRGGFELAPPQLPRVRFAADIKHWTRVEHREEKETRWIKKRTWRSLWLWKTDVRETRTVVRTTTHQGITIDKLGDLLEGFISSAGVSDLEEFFADWLASRIAGFDKMLERRLKDGVRTYRHALEERHDELERDAQSRIGSAEQYRVYLRDAADRAERGRDWRGHAGA